MKLTENEINFLKDELDNERRKSTADQDRIRKFEKILQEKQRKLDDAENEFLRRDSNIKNLEQALAEERRKSMID
jgi:TATA-binding protein-associated factor Taf7